MKPKEEKPTLPVLVRAEVIDHFISLHQGDNVYKTFLKGVIVDIEPITFRNLERKGRVKAAESSTAVPAVGTTGVSPVAKKKRSKKSAGETPTGPTGKMPVLQQEPEKQNGVTTSDHAV